MTSMSVRPKTSHQTDRDYATKLALHVAVIGE